MKINYHCNAILRIAYAKRSFALQGTFYGYSNNCFLINERSKSNLPAIPKNSHIFCIFNHMNDTDIKYLEHKSLKDVPGFKAAMQLRLKDGRPVFIGLRDDALSVFTDEGRQYFYDLEGRPWRLSTLNYTIQRGLSHYGLRLSKRPKERGGGYKRERLNDDELAEFCKELWQLGIYILDALEQTLPEKIRFTKPEYDTAIREIRPVIEKITKYSPDQISKERERFESVYQPIPVLPPDHYRALVLQATEGCSFNTCTFCSLYRGIPFRVRSVEEFDEHIKNALAFHGEALRQRSTIFLGQANAISIPQNRLVELMNRIPGYVILPPKEERPVKPKWTRGKRLHFTGIGAFIDGFTGLKKTVDDYRQLWEIGLDRVYLGVESGSEEILEWIKKPAQPDQMHETIARLKEAGVATDIILLVGIGGKEYERKHLEASIQFIEESPLTKGDRVYLSEVVEYSDAPYYQRMEHDRIPRLTGEEMKKQMNVFKEAIKKRKLQPVPYRIDPFVY